MFKFELGAEVKDVVTGYIGTVTGRVEHLTGCNTYFVQRKYKAGQKIENSEHFDEPRLTATGKSVKLAIPKQSPLIQKPGADLKLSLGKK